MKKVLLVDDEAYVLDLLEQMIEWEFYGFEIIGKAENAPEALKIFHRENPDIIITDICMEQISGIEFITRIRMQDSQVKIIILSAYDKFEYAQKALKLNVDGYLLKPINKEELLDTLLEIQRKLASGEDYKDKISYLQSSLDSLQKKYLEEQLARIFHGEAEELPENVSGMGTWQVLSIRTIDRKEIVFLERDLKEIRELESFLLFVDDGLFALFLLDKTNTGEVSRAVSEIKDKYCDADKTILCGIGIGKGEELGKICRRSKKALNSLFYEDGKFYNRLQRDGMEALKQPEFSEEKLLLWTVNGEAEACIKYFKAYIADCRRYNEDRNVVIENFRHCIRAAQSAVKEQSVRKELEELEAEAGKELRSSGLISLFEKAMSYMSDGNVQLNKSGFVITNAQSYMRIRGLEECFSIDMLAEHLNISKSYLSKVYKEETGESIWNYVMRIRIAKAKEMLVNTDATNFAVAKAIGYSSEYHFSRAFSKSVGMPPSTYKKMYLQMREREG